MLTKLEIADIQRTLRDIAEKYNIDFGVLTIQRGKTMEHFRVAADLEWEMITGYIVKCINLAADELASKVCNEGSN